jgi:hypothetical protein
LQPTEKPGNISCPALNHPLSAKNAEVQGNLRQLLRDCVVFRRFDVFKGDQEVYEEG